MVRGIFFDLDDTLIGYADAERAALAAGCAAAASVNRQVDQDALTDAIYDSNERRYAYGSAGYADLRTLSIDDFRRTLTEDALREIGVDDPPLVDILVQAYAVAEQEHLAAFPDSEATLEALRPHFRLGLITNGPSAMQRGKLAALALEGFFDPIVVDTEFGHPKPDVRIFEHAAEQAGLRADQLLFVGNSLEHDVAGSRAAGWVSVWLAHTDDAEDSGPRPDYRIERLSELMKLPPVAARLEEIDGS